MLRKYRGKLLLTTQGRTLRGDPLALWWLLAQKTPPRSTDASQTQAGLLVLLATAAKSTGELNAIVADLLGTIGWMNSDGTQLTGSMASHATWHTTALLRRMGAVTNDGDRGRRERPTPEGVTFARAALTSWSTAPDR